MKHKCTFCNFQTDDIVAAGQHYDTAHNTLIPEGMSGEHFAYYVYSGRKSGRCVVCHKPTRFNEKTHKYHRICSAKCKRKYGEIKKLNNPKVQEEMLANRSISGEYTWSTVDDSGTRPVYRYTGSYELDFVRYMDTIKHWSPNDLMMPCPYLFKYRYDGQDRFYIPDAYIPSLDLVIEIKDGDPNNPEHHANHHPDIMRVNRVKEKLKKEAVIRSGHTYTKIYNKDYRQFELYIRTEKNQYLQESIDDILQNINDIRDELQGDPNEIFIKIIDAWEEYVETNNLESFCKVSMRINGYIRDQLDEEDFEKTRANAFKRKDFVNGMLSYNKDMLRMTMLYMDSDTDIKKEFSDPYIIYSPEYADAVKKLSKWKKPNFFIYLGDNIEVEDDSEERAIRVEYVDD